MKCKKRKYKDKISAMLALSSCKFNSRKGGNNRNETRIYFCPICKTYHLTSKVKRNNI